MLSVRRNEHPHRTATVIGLSAVLAAAACGTKSHSNAPRVKEGGATDAGRPGVDAAMSDAGKKRDAAIAMDAALDAGAKPSMDAAQNDAASRDAALDAMTLAMMGDASDCIPPGAPKLVFLNKSGGTYTPGPNDARANITSLVSTTVTHAAFTPAADAWKGLLDCVAQKFARFNIAITDEDPTTKEHVEVVVSGSPTVQPLSTGITSVAPMTCTVTPNAIAFVSGAYVTSSPDLGCAAAVAQVAIAYGLEYVSVCPDALSFPQTCPTAGFSDHELTCGDTTAKPCLCSSAATQNSFQRMLAVAGPRCR